jgi:hypothetical protein
MGTTLFERLLVPVAALAFGCLRFMVLPPHYWWIQRRSIWGADSSCLAQHTVLAHIESADRE